MIFPTPYPVLYLDYDGPLHNDEVYRTPKRGIYIKPGFTLFEHCGILEEALQPYPQVKIVLSTSWVRVLGFDRAKSYLPPCLQQRVVGATFHSQMDKQLFLAQSRGYQILSDVCRRKPLEWKWLALDNDDEGWPVGAEDKLILCSDELGISQASVQESMRVKFAATYAQ